MPSGPAGHVEGPLVSVVIPCYNAAATIGETLTSVLRQTYRKVEVVVVDDGSTDGTAAALQGYASHVKVVHQPNGGLARARNAGLAHATGELVALMDADDLCLPERVELQVAALVAHPELVMCGTDFEGFSDAGPVPCSLASYYTLVKRTAGGLHTLLKESARVARREGAEVEVLMGPAYDALTMGNFLHPPTIMFRRSCLAEAGLFDPSFSNVCDYDWILRMSRLGKTGVITAPLLRYRLSANQMSGPKNHYTVMMETLRVVEGIETSNAQFYRSHESRFRLRKKNCLLAAASSAVGWDRSQAVSALARSLRYGWPTAEGFKVALKLLLPVHLLRWVRDQRRLQIVRR